MLWLVVTGTATLSRILLVGPVPGERGGQFGRPFAWTACKILSGWFREIGIYQGEFRERVYTAAIECPTTRR